MVTGICVPTYVLYVVCMGGIGASYIGSIYMVTIAEIVTNKE